MKIFAIIMAGVSAFCFGTACWIPFDWKHTFPDTTFLWNDSLWFVILFLFLGTVYGAVSFDMFMSE